MARFLCGGGWPADYLVVDTETNGLAIGRPFVVPVQVGWALVRGGALLDCDAVLLDWTRPAYAFDVAALAASLEETRRRLADRGQPYHITLERLRAEGEDPATALAGLRDALEAEVAQGGHVVGFNHFGFDMPLLDRVCGRYLGDIVRVPVERMLDLHLVEKHFLAGEPPPAGVSVPDWYARRRGGRVAGGGSLGETCARHGLAIDPDAAHDAAADCRSTHLLLEHYRTLSRPEAA
jgi:DNA polymerase III epsilon subunit-like protein